MAHNVIEEAKRCLKCKNPLCKKGCPVCTPIPEFISAFLNGDINGAGKMLFENNPLSVVCSLVCNHGGQCQGHCVRGIKGEPVEISTVENYISQHYIDALEAQKTPCNGHKVAVVGSGPAGITIAIKLAEMGYDVTIFESKSEIGGVLRYGIPYFRLPKDILDKYKKLMLAMGIKIRFNITIGKPFGIEELFRDGFKAISIGTGVALRTLKLCLEATDILPPVKKPNTPNTTARSSFTTKRPWKLPKTALCLKTPFATKTTKLFPF